MEIEEKWISVCLGNKEQRVKFVGDVEENVSEVPREKEISRDLSEIESASWNDRHVTVAGNNLQPSCYLTSPDMCVDCLFREYANRGDDRFWSFCELLHIKWSLFLHTCPCVRLPSASPLLCLCITFLSLLFPLQSTPVFVRCYWKPYSPISFLKTFCCVIHITIGEYIE